MNRCTIIIFCLIALMLTSCEMVNMGATTSLGNTGTGYSSTGSDFAENASAEEYSDLNKRFARLQQAGGKVPTSVPMTYFDVMDSFREGVQSYNINDRDDDGKTALVIAIEQNDVAMVQFLVEQGALIDDQVLEAAKKSGNSDILSSLEEQK